MKFPDPIRFAKDESGAATFWNMTWAFIFMMLGGMAIDFTNAWTVKNQLQVTADAAALAAALKMDDVTTGKALTAAVTEKNMPAAKNGTVLKDADIIYGIWEASTQTFVPTEVGPNAVRVNLRRAASNSNRVRTMVLGLAGWDYWDLGASATAMTRGGAAKNCSGATIITEGFMETGGNNQLYSGVCLYGKNGIHNGGWDLIQDGVLFGAATLDLVNLNPSLQPDSASPEDIPWAGNLDTKILPQIDTMFDTIWNDFQTNRYATYSGDLIPAQISPTGGPSNVVYVDKNIRIEDNDGSTPSPDEIFWAPNTIYVVDGDVMLAGNVDVQNVAIIADGNIGTGGGNGLYMNDVFFFGAGNLNFSGDVQWGNPATACTEGSARNYLLSKTYLSMGGWGANSGMHGVVGAAPSFRPGGRLVSTGGLYIETASNVSLGGNMILRSCDEPMESDFNHASFGTGSGSYLVR